MILWGHGDAPELQAVPLDWAQTIPTPAAMWSPEQSFGEVRVLTGLIARQAGPRDTLAELLPLVVLPFDGPQAATLKRLAATLDAECRDEAASPATRNQLAGVLMFEALRLHFEKTPPAAGWVRGHEDPEIGPILRQMVDQPGKDWTLVTLAELGSMSRATFARRFRELVGCAPMDWLLELRMSRAAEQLSRQAADLKAIARESGYSSTSAFCAAFKRWSGRSPGELRRSPTGNSLRT
jgi:AraC-like DNA-binding protein